MKKPWRQSPQASYPHNMPNWRPETIRSLPDQELYMLVAQEGANTMQGVSGRVELRRRENATARYALAVSIIALILSAAVAANEMGLFVNPEPAAETDSDTMNAALPDISGSRVDEALEGRQVEPGAGALEPSR